MKKKLIALMLAVVTGVTCTAFSSYAEEGQIVQFQDDFDKGKLFWEGGLDDLTDGTMSFTDHDFLNHKLAPGTLWSNFTVEYDYVDYGGGTGWVGINIGGNQFINRAGGIAIAQDGEKDVGKYKFELGKKYSIKNVVSDNAITVYVKEANRSDYRGAIGRINVEVPPSGISFVGYNRKADISNFKIYANSQNCVKDKVSLIYLGETKEIEFGTDFDKTGLTYESSNTDAVTVDESGVISSIGVGKAVISIKRGNEVVETVYVKSVQRLMQLVFNYNAYMFAFQDPEYIKEYGNDAVVLEVGDTCSLDVTCNPSGASLTQCTWSVSDENVVEMYGISDLERAFTAKKPGEATVNVKSKFVDGVETSIKIVVLPETKKYETKEYKFTTDGTKDAISDAFYGVHISDSSINPTTEQGLIGQDVFVNKVGFTAGRVLASGNTKEKWDNGESKEKIKINSEFFEKNNIAYIFQTESIGVIDPDTIPDKERTLFTDDELLEMVEYVRSVYKGDLYVELGNEIYAIAFKTRFPTVYDYAKWANEFAGKVKAIDPSIKTMAVLIDPLAAESIGLDTGNFAADYEDDGQYTQGWRVVKWNQAVFDNSSNIDIFTNHPYFHTGSQTNGLTENNFLKAGFWHNEANYMSQLYLEESAGGKPLAYTEWGHIEDKVFWGGRSEFDKARVQWQKYPFIALNDMERALLYAKTGCVETMNYHFFNDSQGFGVYQNTWENEEGMKLPQSYCMAEAARLFKEYDYSYDVICTNTDYTNGFMPYYNGGDTRKVDNETVLAFGFGDEEKVRAVVFSNHGDVEQKVSLNGTKLKPVWCYGGDAEEVMPDWARNKKYTHWFISPLDIYSADEMLAPTVYDASTPAAEQITIPPYSIMVCEIAEGDAEVDTSYVGDKAIKIIEYKMRNSIVMKINNSTAYVDRKAKQIDDDSTIVPQIIEGRTLLPLRFVSENFGCEVLFDDNTREITVNGENVEIKMTLGQKQYIVNGEEKELDVVPDIIGGRTFVPIRALGEALGKTVHWDNGIVFLSEFDKFCEDLDKGLSEKLHLLYQ